MEERFEFTGKAKRSIFIVGIVGVVLTILGLIIATTGGGHHDEGGHGEGHSTITEDIQLLASADENLIVYQDHADSASSNEHHEAEHHAEEADHDEGHSEGEHHAEGHGEEHHEDEHAETGHGATADHGEGGHGGEHHGSPTWLKRIYVDLWINIVYFIGVGIIGVFFVAIQYAAQAGWSASVKRVPEAFGAWLPIGFGLMLVLFWVVKGDIFHWTYAPLHDPNSPEYDSIIAGKGGYLNTPFFYARMIVYAVIWYLSYRFLRKKSIEEDLHGGTTYWYKMRKASAIFLVLFAVTSSTAAWDWVMSIDTHWFSTMFGWYTFASWFVTGIAAIILITILLKEAGYLSIVNDNHLHDLGKFLFAFSIFWTYIWFSQFLLIYYANIPEESIYFVERLRSPQYAPFFFVNLILNFLLPFLVLMTRDSKRHMIFLKIVSIIVLVGHWIDFYMMVTPGVMKENGAFGFLEIGITMIFGAAFVYVVLSNLTKASLVAKNHPMLKESIHHHV